MKSSWVDQLHSHSIFTLPFDFNSPLDELARPPSPALSTIFPTSSSHTNLKKILHANQKEPELRGGRKCRVALVRGVDLIVAVGSELRIASLMDVKARCEERDGNSSPSDDLGNISEADLGEYKTLSTPSIKFDIRQLVLNSTSKLLAVVGTHSVAVIVLPRKGWSNAVGRSLECRSLLVGKFYHGLPASPPVAQISWHPWGANSSSLLVLTSDAALREYAISEDAEEPAQTVSFSPKSADDGQQHGRGGAVFSSDDVDDAKAVAFAMGEGKGDWGPLTLYCLMRSGDILAVCPFLPKRASVPSAYIHALSSFVSTKVDHLASHSRATSASSVTPYRAAAPNSSSVTFSDSFSSASPSLAFETRYDFQLKYVSALVKQVTSSLAPSAPTDNSMDVDPADVNRMVDITLPSMARSTPASLQGPFLLQPAPAELPYGLESRACDLTYISYQSSGVVGKEISEEKEKHAPGLGVFAITYSDGKVDLCLEVEKVEARWGDEPVEEEEEKLPSLAVYETIDLGLVAALGSAGPSITFEDENFPTIFRDPLYSDTLYVHHALGAHCLLLSPWLDALSAIVGTSTQDDGEEVVEKLQSEVERVLRQQQATEVLWILKTISVDSKQTESSPVVGLAIVNDVYLGYSALLMTSSLQLVGIELALRVDPSLLPSLPPSSPTKSRGLSSDPPPYLSLLDSPFSIPPPLDKRISVSAVPRLVIKPPPGSSPKPAGGKSELVVTAETLRFMGKTVEQFRHEIRDLVASADIVQCRLELQMKELSRQLSKLAELTRLSDTLRKSTTSAEGLSGRLERVTNTQNALLARTDRLLQKLMDAHEPVLSTYEKKWFDELGRLEKEVTSAKGGDSSLQRRAEHVAAQMKELKPALEELRLTEKKRDLIKGASTNGVTKDGSLASPGGMGAGQMKTFEIKLAEEGRLISEAKEKLERLRNALARTSLS